MKSSSHHIRVTRILVTGIVIGASLLTAGMTAVLATETKHEASGFLQKAEQWENKMSEAFRDAWKSLRGTGNDASVSTASIDLREHMNNYMVRLHLPNRDMNKVEVMLHEDILHIVAPATGKSGRYEETVTLAGADPNATLKIERREKDDMIVVTIPKSAATAEVNRSRVSPDPLLAPPSDRDRDFLGRMEKMNRDMDKIFEESFRDFRLMPEYKGIFDASRFGSAVDLKEAGSNYVVNAYLPDREIKDVNVTVEDRTLKIMAKAEMSTSQSDNGKGSAITRKEQFSQLLTLPGPVQADKMKIERKADMLTVTLPKA